MFNKKLYDIHCRKRYLIFQTFFREGVPSNPCMNLTKTTLKSRKLLSVKEENYYRSTGVNRSDYICHVCLILFLDDYELARCYASKALDTSNLKSEKEKRSKKRPRRYSDSDEIGKYNFNMNWTSFINLHLMSIGIDFKFVK